MLLLLLLHRLARRDFKSLTYMYSSVAVKGDRRKESERKGEENNDER